MPQGEAIQEGEKVIIQMEATDQTLMVDGVECRVWNAVTERRTQCFVFVMCIAVRIDEEGHPDDKKEFDEMFKGRPNVVIERPN
jgi:hypothetical protein